LGCNSGYKHPQGDGIIYSPYVGYPDYKYEMYAVTGIWPRESPFTSGTFRENDSGVRFVFCPNEPESFLFQSGINSGDSFFYLPSKTPVYSDTGHFKKTEDLLGSKIKSHFHFASREPDYYGTGKNFEVTFGVDSDETVTVTGMTDNHAFISGNFTKDHPIGTRMVSINTLHLAPTGETGNAEIITTRISGGKFFMAGSGIQGGCYPGGTFTGAGFTFIETPVIDVYRGFKYLFNQHHGSNSNPDEWIMFSYTSGGHHNGGVPITGKYELDQGGSLYCFNNYCHYHCPDEQTFMIPIDSGAGDKIYYYSSGTDGMGGTGYLNVMISGDGGK
jgi:hypothetical protein